MPTAIEQWLVTGRVIDENTKQAGYGFEIRVFDRDFSDDQYLGSTHTGEDGRFAFRFSLRDFEDNVWRLWGLSINFRERLPDLYFRVYYFGALVANLDSEVFPNQEDKELELLLEVPFPSEALDNVRVEQAVYLRIEPLFDYSPVEPETGAGYAYRRDCFRRPGHEDGSIPQDEVDMRRFTALVYRQYTDASFTTPVTSKLVASDLSEPSAERCIPTVIYTQPGRRLVIHVHNADSAPHSLHLHGLRYGVDSDGAFPVGLADKNEVRSDAICPGRTYTYTYDVTRETIGNWTFHDHCLGLGEMTRRGLFGGVVVRDPCWPEVDHEIPLFFHQMAGRRAAPLFDSGDILPGGAYARAFDSAGSFNYECFYHGVMQGGISVAPGGPTSAEVSILDDTFDPTAVTIAPGGTITWTNNGATTHTVTENGASTSNTSMAINGRTHAGNTPVIEVSSGETLRWYVFNLDLGQGWHNFHAHASRWSLAGQNIDNQSIGPAESFVVHTEAPPVVLPAYKPEHQQGPGQEYDLASLFPVHCHVETHVMAGMICLLRVKQRAFLHTSYVDSLTYPLPLDPGGFTCPAPPDPLCIDEVDAGSWAILTPSPVFAVHSALLRTGKVIMWSGHAELGLAYGTVTALYDPATDSYTTVPFTDSDDLFCAGHTFLPDGRLITGGGANQGQVDSTHIFDPVTETWSHLPTGQMSDPRWYPTMVAMADGRTAVVSGTSGAGGVVEDIEVLDISDPSPSWQVVSGGSKPFSGLYPGLHWLPSGDMFFTRTGWNSHALGTDEASMFRFSGPAAGSWTNLAPLGDPDRKEGASVLLIDDTGPAPVAKIFVAGGRDSTSPAISRCEIIDVSNPATTPGWTQTAEMANPRIGVGCVVLPDGKVMVIGGRQTSSRFDTAPVFVFEAEIYDPATDSWAVTPPMTYGRQYHSSACLLPDARVFVSGGVDASLGWGAAGNQQTAEAYSPEYLSSGSPPAITAAPSSAAYGASITVDTQDATAISSVALLAPCAATHHTDSNQRYVRLSFASTNATQLQVDIPASPGVAPPGYYMLFLVDNAGAPSVAHFLSLG